MRLRDCDGMRVRIVDRSGDLFEGVCTYNLAEYNEHEYGRAEESLQILHFLFFKSDIHDLETLNEADGPFGGFSAPYGNIEQMSVDEGAERIGEILFSEEAEHIVRLLRCLEKYFLPGTSWRLEGRAEVLDAVGELRTVTQNETVRAQAESLLELVVRGGGESL